MPYKSRAQAAYFNIHRAALERQGVDVGEWNAASQGRKLPRKIAGGRGILSPRKAKAKPAGIR